MTTTTPAATTPATQNLGLGDALKGLLPQLLPLLLPWLLQLIQSQAQPTPQPTPRPNPKPDLEDIEPPGPDPVPQPLPRVGEGRLDILGFIHQPGGRIFWPDKTVDLDGNVIEANGNQFWARFNGQTPLNVRTKIMVTPTFFDPSGRELTRADWEALGWRSWVVEYHAKLDVDSSNPESITAPEAGFVHGGGADQPVIVTPDSLSAFTVGGRRYRDTHGDSATYNVFKEGLFTIFAKTLTGHVTQPRNFVVR